jgi:hypothetical protein
MEYTHAMQKLFKRCFFVISVLFAASCAQQPEVQQMPGGAILYAPQADDNVRPDIETPTFVYANVIVDRATGYRLYQERASIPIPEFGDKHMTLWRLDRSRKNQPAIFFLTRSLEEDGNWFSRRSGLEIVHAHVDGFFPFRDALEPRAFSFERVVSMLDRYNQKERPKFLTYLDNRLAYREQSTAAQRNRDRSPFLRANFDYDPLANEGAAAYFPSVNSARFDAGANAAIASDGTVLRVTNGTWSMFTNRSGRPSEFRAEWAEQGGRNPWIVRMTCLRSYREGYGETRAVEVVSFERPTFRGNPIDIVSPGSPPSGEALAALINVSAPIAGPHAGHMVVVVSKEAGSAAGNVHL